MTKYQLADLVGFLAQEAASAAVDTVVDRGLCSRESAGARIYFHVYGIMARRAFALLTLYGITSEETRP